MDLPRNGQSQRTEHHNERPRDPGLSQGKRSMAHCPCPLFRNAGSRVKYSPSRFTAAKDPGKVAVLLEAWIQIDLDNFGNVWGELNRLNTSVISRKHCFCLAPRIAPPAL